MRGKLVLHCMNSLIIKWDPFLRFWCDICACKFMLAYTYHALFCVGNGGRGGGGGGEGGWGGYLKYSPVAAKIILLCLENAEVSFCHKKKSFFEQVEMGE